MNWGFPFMPKNPLELVPTPLSPPPLAGRDGFAGECAQFFGGMAQVFGLPRSVGQIYGLLFASPGPLSFSDIVARLEISKGSASQGLQFLRNLGAVHEAAAGADSERREYYQPELGLRKLMAGLLREKVEPLAKDGPAWLAQLRAGAAGAAGAEAEFFQERVEQIEAWNRQLRRLLPVLKTLLGPAPRRAR